MRCGATSCTLYELIQAPHTHTYIKYSSQPSEGFYHYFLVTLIRRVLHTHELNTNSKLIEIKYLG